MRAAATSTSPSRHVPRASAARRAQGRASIAPTAPPITSRRGAVGAWRRGRSRSASRPTASTSTTAAARPIRSCSQETVVASGADIGLALDGDADRLIVVDETGELIDGDQLMALIALGLQRARRASRRRHRRDGDVQPWARTESRGAGSSCCGPQVGDRYVLEAMRGSGCNVGGEQSGHIILSDYATTGDGLVAGLQVLAALVEAEGRRASCSTSSSRCRSCSRTSASTAARAARGATASSKRIAAAEAELEGKGRLVIRKSGTEPVIRVMAEGDDPGAGRAGGRRHLRGGAVGGVNTFLVFVGQTTMPCTWKISPRGVGRRR